MARALARHLRVPLPAVVAVGLITLFVISPMPGGDAQADGAAVAVAGGFEHTCAVTGVGGVKCWGDNSFGQLGNGTNDPSPVPVDVCAAAGCDEPLGGIVAVTANQNQSCALTEQGGVLCWGLNDTGQLGDGTSTDRTTPVQVAGLDRGVAAIDAGFSHTCGLMVDGGVKCWGNNSGGQLGNNTTESSTVPVDVCEFVLILGASDAAGSGPAGEIEVPCSPISYATSVSAGALHTCVVTDETGVRCWGSDAFGQLGNVTDEDRLTPGDVCTVEFVQFDEPQPSGILPPPCAPVSGVEQVSAGGTHTCALKSDTGVLCWGRNESGQLGDNSTNDHSTPVEVCEVLLVASKTASPSGLAPPCAATDGIAGVSAAIGGFTCALTVDGEGRCWGRNLSGQLGDGSAEGSLTPVSVVGLGEGLQVSAGLGHACAVTMADRIRCWGFNREGQVGDGSIVDRHTAVDVVGFDGKPEPTATATGTVTPTSTAEPGGLIGDVDCSGEVNAIDAAFVLQFVAGLVADLPCSENADANEDGEINTIDAALILQVSAGLLGMLPP